MLGIPVPLNCPSRLPHSNISITLQLFVLTFLMQLGGSIVFLYESGSEFLTFSGSRMLGILLLLNLYEIEGCAIAEIASV